jgi:Cu+-exporting ATPase
MFRHIRQVVFDKTGTLTTGKFTLSTYQITSPDIDDATFRKLIYSLEKYSNHPIAQCLTTTFKQPDAINWKKVEEVKGSGLTAIDQEGNSYQAGSGRFIKVADAGDPHNVYLTKNGLLIGWIDVIDEIRPEASGVVQYLKQQSIRTILLSGDTRKKCEQLAATLGIDEVYAEKSPEDKLALITRFNNERPTVMVGDGINDAPALARATIGLSMSDAAHVAIQTADVVLMNNGLKHLSLSLGLGRQTYVTIKQNLFWAFSYNIVAIPVAALGMLGTYGPTYGALLMGLSDVVLAINSVRLYFKKIA